MKIIKPVRVARKTPVEELHDQSVDAQLFIKRDDLNGLVISGNKARKMEYLIADAKARKCNSLVTCGGLQSNHCRTVAAFAVRFGFSCQLFLRGQSGRRYTGNTLIDKLLGAQVTCLTPAQYKWRDEIMSEYAHRIRKLGCIPYVIPEGGSNEVGCLGYLDCMKEMTGFIDRKKIDAVYCAVGSGGTYAGLLLGKLLFDVATDVIGVIVCDTVQYFTERILAICRTAIDRYGLNRSVDNSDVSLVDGFIGKGYGIPYTKELETIRRVARQGIILDPVYTGKAFCGMIHHMKRKKYRRVIFLHTGGIFSIFAYAKHLSEILR